MRGIVQSRGRMARDGRRAERPAPIRFARAIGCFDGIVRTITRRCVVLMQEVNDPLSLEKQREVRKSLRGEVK